MLKCGRGGCTEELESLAALREHREDVHGEKGAIPAASAATYKKREELRARARAAAGGGGGGGDGGGGDSMTPSSRSTKSAASAETTEFREVISLIRAGFGPGLASPRPVQSPPPPLAAAVVSAARDPKLVTAVADALAEGDEKDATVMLTLEALAAIRITRLGILLSADRKILVCARPRALALRASPPRAHHWHVRCRRAA
jgi:hypothetical protein